VAPLRGKNVLEVEGSMTGLILYPVVHRGGIFLLAANLTRDVIQTSVQMPTGGITDIYSR
jgi:hypothetical protein